MRRFFDYDFDNLMADTAYGTADFLSDQPVFLDYDFSRVFPALPERSVSEMSGDDYAADITTSGVVVIDGAPVSGSIETSGDRDWLAFTVTASYDRDWFAVDYMAGDFISVIARYENISDINIRLFDASGSEVTFGGLVDDGVKYLSHVINETGTYYIQIDSGAPAYEDIQTDSYTVTSTIVVDDFTQDMPGVIAADGVAVSGHFDYGGDNDYFQFDVTQTGEYGFVVEGLDPDYLFVHVLTPSGQRIRTPNTTTEGSSEITYNFDELGSYQIIAFGAPGADGNAYTLRSTNVVDDYSNTVNTTGTLVLDGAASTGEINYVGDVDWFAVELTAGEIVDFVLTGDLAENLYPGLTLFNQFGNSVTFANNGNKNVAYEVETTATYYFGVGSENVQSTGTYSIAVSTIDDDFNGNTSTLGFLVDGVVTSGSLETNFDSDWFRFQADSDGFITFYLDYAVGDRDVDLNIYDALGSYTGNPQNLGNGVFQWYAQAPGEF